VGLILTLLTIFLFIGINTYFVMTLTRRTILNQNTQKLATKRGYYEQTAEEVQKVLRRDNHK
jgi:hypothetical protein